MDCPKCVGKLQKKQMEKIEVDSCFVCEGVWFDAGELEEAIKRDAHDFKFISVGKEIFDGAEIAAADIDLNKEEGKCPRCDTLMNQTEYEKNRKVKIDICPKGCGIWLDGGEILSLRQRGLVNLRDWFDNEKDFLRYAFSKDGWGDLMSRSKQRQRKEKKQKEDK